MTSSHNIDFNELRNTTKEYRLMWGSWISKQ